MKWSSSFSREITIPENENSFSGIIVTLGRLTRNRSVLFPGIIEQSMIDSFMQQGAIFNNHDPSQYVAMPTSMELQGNVLVATAEFHTTPDVVALKQKCMERIKNKLPVGLSITMSMAPGGAMFFENGKELLKYAERKSYDVDSMDKDAISGHNGYLIGYYTAQEILEYSLAPIPADDSAAMRSINSISELREKCLAGVQLSTDEEGLLEYIQFENGRDHSSLDRGIIKARVALANSELVM